MKVERSNQLYERARRIIPGGTQTISKRPEKYVRDRWPAYWDHAEGAHVWDVDGNGYIDYVMALGPIILGYAHPAVDEAITRQLRKGMLTSLNSALEIEVAELMIAHIACAEMVRFFKTGAEATTAALRIARACTGREKVISCGYAGWHDWWVAKRRGNGTRGGEDARGVPKALAALVFDLEYGDVAALESLVARHGADIACVTIDTMLVDDSGDFLRTARSICDRHGIVLVFDEIITGFRLGLGGAQQLFGVTPDLATFGKAMANGMPLSATVGRRELMEIAADLWISSTFAGEALSLAAAKATIRELAVAGVLDRVHAISDTMAAAFRAITGGQEGVEAFGLISMPGVRFLNGGEEDEEAAGAFVENMLDEGILTRRNYAFFVSAALTDEDVARTVEAVEDAVSRVAAPIV
ncbi:MAG: aminotransferase class III-fold pyridoxal phosphate-dependent enzyme [Nitrospiraceae bacterium]|nr:aminotransferase class III-fold pyridoxal phosphate-dependent enzyme [Nitrospiraceae bacterium]